ncbi:UDP-N-acetylmuramoyl-L-alanyl-D-glutamate--2,6-diaminopimelate ligase [Paludicola sp. MB14-C6]|uniref:Mur ligase family protein n=1 Tax=Paludihabitans sp. MB14-C6 TaxID=3070656 RepID=UPI0027DE5D2F|nr:UDP-N-acetylmuramoyl-L-alanyl-D-glutamate--2,6-diaminopimelate ligase [Paludicola sp. MB14-C6]WMJ22218.1 UDP-N-acetylmuramoyl-L-alanyl-D-glutamate--2,6-diaminopimelate ligase [Paludicola sp. MB14-C6]
MKVYSIPSYIEMLNEEGLLVESKVVDPTIAIEHITYNSKDTKPYTLFACKGASFKKDYLDEAVDHDIACYLSETKYDTNKPVSYLIVSNIRKAMALVADAFYDQAYSKLNLIGITGTKGKSTTSYYIKYIFDEYLQSVGKKPSGIVSSIDVYDGIIKKEAHLTTPEAFELHEHFDNAVKSGIEYFEMEVSSQALKYDRVLGVTFDVSVFLNISEDHISPIEHSDYNDYLNAKLKIFNQCKLAVVNLNTDDKERVLKAAKQSPLQTTFGYVENADYYGYNIKKENDAITFMCKGKNFNSQFKLTMPGLFNVENALAAIAVCDYYHIPLEHIQNGLAKARSSGRMEIFSTPDQSVIAIVDYAHNKLSFEKLYQSTLEEYKGRKIITVFGCPGGKAYNRRVELGDLSGKYSNKVYLTAEDPAYESVNDISKEIEKYVTKHPCECFLIDDRGEAIQAAILEAEPNSIILITGKGNETRQKIGSTYVPCPTDSDYAKQFLAEVAARAKINE